MGANGLRYRTGVWFRVKELLLAAVTTRRAKGGTSVALNVLKLVLLAVVGWAVVSVAAPMAVASLCEFKASPAGAADAMVVYAGDWVFDGWSYVEALDVPQKWALTRVVLIIGGGLWIVLAVTAVYNMRSEFGRTVFGGPKARKSGTKGTGYVETNQLALASVTRTWKPGTPLVHAGLILGYSPVLHRYYLSGEKDHTQTIAPPDVGKTTRFVYPTIDAILASEDSAVLVDPKGEIYDNTYEDAIASGANVLCIDYANWRRSNCYNTLSVIAEAYAENMEAYARTVELAAEAQRAGDNARAGALALDARNYRVKALSRADALAGDLANSLIPDKEGSDQFWRPSARSLDRAMNLLVATYDESDWQGEGPAPSTPAPEQRSMKTIRNLLDLYGKPIKRQVGKKTEDYVPLEDLFQGLDRDHPASKAFAQAKNSPNMTLGGIISTLLQVIDELVDEENNMMSYKTDFTFDSIGREKTVVYLVVPEESPAKFGYLPVFLSQAYQAFARLARECGGTMPRYVHFLEEEKGSMPAVPRYGNMLATGRGYGVRYHAIMQNPYQWDETYGPKTAKAIKPLFNTTCWLKVNDYESAEELSKKIGDYTVAATQSAMSSPVSEPLPIMSGTTTTTARDDTARVVPASKLLSWDPMWGTFVERTKLERNGLLNRILFHRHEANVALFPTTKANRMPTFRAFGLERPARAQAKARRAQSIDLSSDRVVVPPWDAVVVDESQRRALSEMFAGGYYDRATQRAINAAYWSRAVIPDARLAADTFADGYSGEDAGEWLRAAVEHADGQIKRSVTLANRYVKKMEDAAGLERPYSFESTDFVCERTEMRSLWMREYASRIEDRMERRKEQA